MMNAIKKQIAKMLGRVDFDVIEIDINTILSGVSDNQDTSDKDNDTVSGQALTAEDVVNTLRYDPECMRDLYFTL
jgi:hypothetical protein